VATPAGSVATPAGFVATPVECLDKNNNNNYIKKMIIIFFFFLKKMNARRFWAKPSRTAFGRFGKTVCNCGRLGPNRP
jgi:hypothetical protein